MRCQQRYRRCSFPCWRLRHQRSYFSHHRSAAVTYTRSIFLQHAHRQSGRSCVMPMEREINRTHWLGPANLKSQDLMQLSFFYWQVQAHALAFAWVFTGSAPHVREGIMLSEKAIKAVPLACACLISSLNFASRDKSAS